ncbi:MAG: ABC transporter substrate-binding protein [Bacteroidaceae bacterium]|nr:ABC transporter substrate-binding protein [Bacteroidaceae bacterium]
MKGKWKRWLVLWAVCLTSVGAWAAEALKVAVLMPLKEQSPRGETVIEFYQGLLMAVAQLKGEGQSVDVYALDSGTDEAQMETVLRNSMLTKMDVIFGPADGAQIAPLADFCRQHGIRMVMPFNTPCNQLYSNPWIYQVGVAQEQLYPGITALVMDQMENSHFVVYHSGEQDERAQSFTNHLTQVFALRQMQVTSLPAGADVRAFEQALNQFRENVIIPDSRSLKAVKDLLAGLKAFRADFPQYKVKLLGYPEWLTYTSVLLKDFYALDTRVFSAYYRNPLSGRVLKFEQQYRQNFGKASRNSFPRAEMLGYDLGCYFLRGLARYGADFDNQHAAMAEAQPLQQYFRFQRVGEQGGFINLHVQLVHYGANNTIQVEK